jgi:hypothetical protein
MDQGWPVAGWAGDIVRLGCLPDGTQDFKLPPSLQFGRL